MLAKNGPIFTANGISIVSQIIIPLGLCFVLQQTRGLQATDVWLAILLGHITRATLSVIRFRQGKWRDIVVDIGGKPSPDPAG